MMRTFGLVLSVALLLAVVAAAPARAGEQVTLYRDVWGVPHIYAETELGAFYGQGYAQAEYRLEALLRNYRVAAGTMAEAFGPEFVEQDYIQRLVGHEKYSRERYSTIRPEVRAAIEAYQAGVRRYMEEHPEKVPDWVPKVEPWQVIAVGRLIIFNWPLGEAEEKLSRRERATAQAGSGSSGERLAYQPVEPNIPFGSNQWSVGPARTADGCAILLIDPHVDWTGPIRFDEVRLHGGDVNASGVSITGAPFLGLGHNQYLGWAATTGGPSTTDIYVLDVDPDNPMRYRYDDGWKDITSEEVVINVKGGEPVKRTIEYSHYGPILLREGNKAYALACPYLDQVDFITNMYLQMKARNLDEFKAAMALNQWMYQNIMYADVEGNIYYLRTGRVPIRPKGYDFMRPVPGNTSATAWLGIHPMGDLVQILNPADGYMQNCNCDPAVMTMHPAINPQDYPYYIYNSTPGSYHERGWRARHLLDSTAGMTLDQAVAVACDTYVDWSDEYLRALSEAAKAWASDPRISYIREPLKLLGAWNGRLEIESVGATLFDRWAQKPQVEALRDAMLKGQDLTRDQQAQILMALYEAAESLRQQYGRLDVQWGDIHRVRRGEESWPGAGGGYVLRSFGWGEPDAKGIVYGTHGQSATTVVLFKPGHVESYSLNPLGQSDDPSSPHYDDQAKYLYARKQLKPTLFYREDLMPSVTSTTTLSMP
jgi:acyl-homoserine lactone acylase PvdQ